MWLGAAAGLALFPFFLARLTHARNDSYADRQLTFDGGWRVSSGPLECAAFSETVHSTNNVGDDLTVNFTGNAIYVFGPRELPSSAITIFLDDERQPVSPSVDSEGCSVLYRSADIVNGQHILYMVYSDNSRSSLFSVSGIIVTTPDVPTTSPTVAPPTISSSPAPVNVVPTTTTVDPPPIPTVNPNSTDPAASDPSSSDGSDSVPTSAFVTPSGMTASLIGAIVGALLGMVALLLLFIFIRRRITRSAARKRENNTERNIEEGTVKGEEAYGSPWSKSEKQQHSEAGPSGLGDDGSIRSGQFSSTMVTISHASHGSGGLLSTSSHRAPSTTYTVDFGSALLNRTPEPTDSARHTPTRLTTSIPTIDASTPRSATVASHRTPTSEYAFTSSGATRGSPKVRGREQSAYVVNGSGSAGSSARTRSDRGSDPPPGFL